MPVFNNALAGAAGQATGGAAADYTIDRSLRFNDDDSSYLIKTFVSGNVNTYTVSFWVKRGNLGSFQTILSSATGSTSQSRASWDFTTDDRLYLGFNPSGSSWLAVEPDRRFRDTSAWYHIVVSVDTTQSTNTDKVKIYVNGVREEAFNTYDTLPADLNINNAVGHAIGRYQAGTSNYFDGYLAEFHFIDGQALDETYFGQFDDNGVWQPKQVSGVTYGTNGFYLDFSDASSNAALGYDAAGSNDWTVNNLTARGSAWDQSQTWSTNVTNPNGAYGAASNAFDGDLTTHASPNNANPMTYTHPVSNTVISSFRIYTAIYDATSITLELNGTDIKSQVSTTTGWQTITGFSGDNFSTLKWAADPSNYEVQLRAIEVNGIILVDSGIADPELKNIDSLLDSPTNYDDGTNVGGNYCVLNPLNKNSNTTLSNGNLGFYGSGYPAGVTGTIGVSSGKWYYEINPTAGPYDPPTIYFGFADVASFNLPSSGYIYLTDGVYTYCPRGAYKQINGTQTATGFGNGNLGSTFGVALDLDNGTLQIYEDGSLLGTIDSTMSGTFVPLVYADSGSAGDTANLNFGQRPFMYPPGGTGGPAATFKALCTQNLDDPLIEDSSTEFEATTYTGNNSFPRDITGVDFSPDLVWTKARSQSYRHMLFDTVRGTGKNLSTNNPNTETTDDPYGYISAFNSDGWTIAEGSTSGENFNADTETYVAWAWDGGDLATNSAYHQSEKWSDLVTGTLDSSFGNSSSAAPFDGDTGSSYSDGITPTSGNYLSMNFGTTFANATSVKIYGYASLDGNSYTGANENLKINGTAIGAGDWTATGQSSATFSLSNGLTSLEWGYSSGSTSTGYLYLSGIEVDGKLLVDLGVIPAGSLNSSLYLQGDVYSGDLSTNDTLSNATNAFDGDVSTRAQTVNAGASKTLTWAPSPAVSFSQLFEIYCDQGNDVPTATWNNNSVSPGGGKWVTVYAGSGTIDSTYPLVINTNTAGQFATLNAVRLDGKILVDSNVTLADVPTLATTVRANPSAGFSIASYTGNLTANGSASVAHNLNAVPELIITKQTDGSSRWTVQHKDLADNHLLVLDNNAGSTSYAFGDLTNKTSSIFSTNYTAGMNTDGDTFLALCFAPVEGFSAFGTYIGNEDLDGPFVYTGFRPRFILQKSTASETYGSWHIYDTARDPVNAVDNELYADSDLSEGSIPSGDLDILSNGFKIRTNNVGGWNTSGTTYIYAAFGDPFKYARAR